ncbi:MAG: Holliday junction branch migration DNA helicase RuvB [Deltaproteobacteria bacterium]|nr:Holliday junction branch migration DNA helicase RuvB [Deltaproteobacteria bacterium]
MNGERAIAPTAAEDEQAYERSLRPKSFAEFVGQRLVVDKLEVYVEAARRRSESLDHVLLSGPPGLGKTSLAHIIARELGVQLHVTSGPAIERKGDLAGILTSLEEGDILFVDEVHRLPRVVEESLYTAMEDYEFDVILGDGPAARSVKLELSPFTLVGATTRTGLLTGPMRDRFGIVERLDFYDAEALEQIVERSARILQVQLEKGGAAEMARRARGTPRVANRLLRRVRDFAEVEGSGSVDREAADLFLGRLGVDERGLDTMDRRLLEVIIERFEGGPVGIGTIAAAVGEKPDTLEEVYEPYLVQQGLLARTPRGRVATTAAYTHLGKKPTGRQGSLV